MAEVRASGTTTQMQGMISTSADAGWYTYIIIYIYMIIHDYI